MSRHDAYRAGKVHVLREPCATCVFRPGNLMELRSGRVRDMIDAALEEGSAIVCHATLYGATPHNAVCRGFYDRHAGDVLALRLARIMDVVEFDEPPCKPPSSTA